MICNMQLIGLKVFYIFSEDHGFFKKWQKKTVVFTKILNFATDSYGYFCLFVLQVQPVLRE